VSVDWFADQAERYDDDVEIFERSSVDPVVDLLEPLAGGGALELAGMSLRERWANRRREPFTADSTSHVSVWEKIA
jgi:hypothetical protein